VVTCDLSEVGDRYYKLIVGIRHLNSDARFTSQCDTLSLHLVLAYYVMRDKYVSKLRYV